MGAIQSKLEQLSPRTAAARASVAPGGASVGRLTSAGGTASETNRVRQEPLHGRSILVPGANSPRSTPASKVTTEKTRAPRPSSAPKVDLAWQAKRSKRGSTATNHTDQAARGRTRIIAKHRSVDDWTSAMSPPLQDLRLGKGRLADSSVTLSYQDLPKERLERTVTARPSQRGAPKASNSVTWQN